MCPHCSQIGCIACVKVCVRISRMRIRGREGGGRMEGGREGGWRMEVGEGGREDGGRGGWREGIAFVVHRLTCVCVYVCVCVCVPIFFAAMDRY